MASQFGLRAIPTVYLFQNGQPVDGFQGPQPEEAIRALLDKVLPREEELKAQEGNAADAGRQARREALPLLKEAWQLWQPEQRNWPAAGGNADCPEPQRRSRSRAQDGPVAGSGYPLSGPGCAD